jgi:bacillopeptidase F
MVNFSFKKTRQDRIQEQKSSHLLFFSIAIGIIMLVAIAVWGIPSLISMSIFISNLNHKNDTQIKNTDSDPVFPPILDPVAEATNSSPISVGGYSGSGNAVELYLNDVLDDKTNVDEKGQFLFSNVDLKIGSNSIYVKSQRQDKQSDKSQIYSIVYKKTLPKLEIEKPDNNQIINSEKKETSVSGITDPGNTVTINDHFVIVNTDGKFSYNIILNEGNNILIIVASDKAGNKTTTERKITYSTPF